MRQSLIFSRMRLSLLPSVGMLYRMKMRVTVSLPGTLVKQAERVGQRLGARSRSATVEHALHLLVARAREREIDASLDAYYRSLTSSERAEDRRMVRAFNRSQRRHDLDDEGR